MTRLDRVLLDAIQLCGPNATVGGHIIPFVEQRLWLLWPSSLWAALRRLEEAKLIVSVWADMPEPRIKLYSAVNAIFDPDHVFTALTYSTDDGVKHPVGLYSTEQYAIDIVAAGVRAGFKVSFYTLHSVTQRDLLYQQWIRLLGMDMCVPYVRSLRDSAKWWTPQQEDFERTML